MADNQQQPPDQQGDQRRPAGGPPQGPEPDETREIPVVDERPEVPPDTSRDNDGTVAMPRADDDTSGSPASGPPRAGDTATLPPASVWSGRAGVPPPDTAGVREAVPVDEWQEPVAGGRWLLPVVLALVALAVIALLGLGLWLILREDANSIPGAPAVTASGSSFEPSQTSPATPTGVSTEPTGITPQQVVVPRLVGMDSDTARSILDRAGLTYRLTSRVSSQAPPGTVLETDPSEGSVVDRGSRITLVIASAPPTSAAPSPAGSPTTPAATPSD